MEKIGGNIMSDKLVHVNAYTKDDGTKVREHYRGGVQGGFVEGGEFDPSAVPHGIADGTCTAGSIEELFKSRGGGLLDRLKKILNGDPEVYKTALNDGGAPVLEGGVSTEVYYPSGAGIPLPEMLGQYNEVVQVVMATAEIASGLAIKGAETVAAIKFALKNWDKVGAAKLGIQMEEVVGQMRQAHDVAVSAEQKTLEKLSNTTNQREYKELYDTYLAQRESNRATGAIINRIAYSVEHKNYDDVERGLNEYKTLQTDSAVAVRDRASVNMEPNYLKFEEQAIPESYLSISENIGDLVRHTIVPNIEKIGIGGITNLGYYPARDANMLWKIATDDVRGYKDYVEQNGYFVDSISDLPFDFKDAVRAKVKQQLGVDDLRGLVLYPDSTLAQNIINSSEYQNFIRTSMNKLQRGEVISGSVGYTLKTLNLGAALGRADILDTYINKNGDIISFVLDTYDFNKGESWYIERARDVQEHELLNAYYSITILFVPKEQWLSWVVVN